MADEKTPSPAPTISVVVPVYNEEKNLPELHRRLKKALAGIGGESEIILVDDGSADGSRAAMLALRREDPSVRIIGLSRNFGQAMALAAGIDRARGEAIVMLDADLQHPPELIPQLVARWRAGARVVNTARREGGEDGPAKRLTSRLFYAVLRRIADIDLPPGSADFRLIDRTVADALKSMKERARFWRGLVRWAGFRQECVAYQADVRHAGKSAYSLPRMLTLAADGITSFSAFPLRLAAYLGLIVTTLSFLYILYALAVRIFTARAIPGWTSVLTSVLFLGGVQLVFLGVIGEYLVRVFEETKARPLYIVDEIHGL
jgi:dolichol-phosphate mannosyltransferase